MSHTVVRGEPTAAQLYLDVILDEILRDKGIAPDRKERSNIILAELVYHCMKKLPDTIFMINGATGEKFTNGQLLRRSVSLARSMMARGLKGKIIMVMMRNHQNLASVYWAVLFSGVIPFIMDPVATVFELNYFLNLLRPCLVFCEHDLYHDIMKALNDITDLKPEIVLSDEDQQLSHYIGGDNEGVGSFQIPESSPESTVLLLPTSGSTGLPKAVLMNNRGLIAHLPSPWMNHDQFPKPTKLVRLLTTAQWVSFSNIFTSCAVYQVPLLVSPETVTVKTIIDITEKFRPTWGFFNPAFAKGVLASVSSDQMSSLQSLMIVGSPATLELMAGLRAKLPKTTHLYVSYGTTETHGPITITERQIPFPCYGRVFNIFEYKVMNEYGVQVKPGNQGELYVKGESIMNGYFKDDVSFKETLTDGWYKTGDWFYWDENELLYFLRRTKFSFKFKGRLIAPEEVEAVIETVPGVCECVVCETESGPASAVVQHPNCDVTRAQIHQAVEARLSDHKWLHGGIAFVDSLSHTSTGKLRRAECKKMIHQLIEDKLCF